MDEENQQDEKSGLPKPEHGAWRIELHYLPIGPRGHAFFTLVNPSGEPVSQLHGLAQSRNTDRIVPFGSDGARLVVPSDYQMSPEKTRKISDVASGTYDEIVLGKWVRGLKAGAEINKRNLDYKSDDLSYELVGGKGGQIQNSNSTAYTHSKAMDVDADEALRDAGLERKFPGWGRNLLDRDYQPYVAPPVFPNANAP
jgi:hypothetical protein